MKSWVSCLPGEFISFLSRDEVLAIHAVLLKRFGGPEGVRDLGLLASALHRPQSGYYPDLVTMAAAMFESLIKNHPFVDGNKRVAFFATDIFLRLNGYRFDVEAQATYGSLMQLFDSNQCDMQHLQPWISASIIKLAE